MDINDELKFAYVDVEQWEPTENKYIITIKDIIDDWFGECEFLGNNESEITHASVGDLNILKEKYYLAEELGWTIEVLLQYLIDVTGYRKDEQID